MTTARYAKKNLRSIESYFSAVDKSDIKELRDNLCYAANNFRDQPDNFDFVLAYMQAHIDIISSTAAIANVILERMKPKSSINRTLNFAFGFFDDEPDFLAIVKNIQHAVLGHHDIAGKEQAALAKEPRIAKIGRDSHSILFSDGLELNMPANILHRTKTSAKAHYKKIFTAEMKRLETEMHHHHHRKAL